MSRRVVSLSVRIVTAAMLSILSSMVRADDRAALAANADDASDTIAASDTSAASETSAPPETSGATGPSAASETGFGRGARGAPRPNFAPALLPAPTAANRAAAAATSDGSVLRLVAGVQGIAPEPGSQFLEPIPTPEPSMSAGPPAPPPLDESYDAIVPDGAAQSMPHFTNPHEATDGDSYVGMPTRHPLFHLPPPGIIPLIGPRTREDQRFVGWGEPLYGASWLNRPFGAGFFAGFMQGSAPIRGLVGQHGGFFGGYRFTWDYDYYYGLEARLGGGAIGLKYPGYDYPTATSDLYVADISVFYYPLGDSRWRPFVSAGLGTTKISFYDREDAYYGGVLVSTPVSIGLKYRWREWLALRGEVMDNIAYGRGPFNSMNNVSFTLGVEVRFGGLRKTYFPWHPSGQIW